MNAFDELVLTLYVVGGQMILMIALAFIPSRLLWHIVGVLLALVVIVCAWVGEVWMLALLAIGGFDIWRRRV